MCVIIKKDRSTISMDSFEKAINEADYGDIIVHNNKEYHYPDYPRYIYLTEKCKNIRTLTERNKALLEELKKLTTEILLWEISLCQE